LQGPKSICVTVSKELRNVTAEPLIAQPTA